MKKNKINGFWSIPKGQTKKLYGRNLLSLVFLVALALGAFLWHTISHGMWIRNYISSGYELDCPQAEASMGVEELTPSESSAIDSSMLVTNMGIPSMVEQGFVYFQDGKDYRFALPMDSITETGIYYDDTYTAYFGVTDPAAWLAEVEAIPPIQYEATEGTMADYYIMPMSRLVRITSGDANLLALVAYDAVLTPGESLRGIFTSYNATDSVDGYTLGTLAFPDYYLTDYAHSLYLSGKTGDSVIGYIFEAQDVPVEFEDENYGYMILYGILFLIVFAIALLFFIKPGLHPFFRQMQRYGTYEEITKSIDSEFADGQKFMSNSKMLLSDHWYIKRSGFMNVINKNPDQIPENQKAREGSINKRRYSDTTQAAPVDPLAADKNYDPLKENMKNRYNKYY